MRIEGAEEEEAHTDSTSPTLSLTSGMSRLSGGQEGSADTSKRIPSGVREEWKLNVKATEKKRMKGKHEMLNKGVLGGAGKVSDWVES